MSTLGRVVAVVPARAGSKGIPGKNLRRVGGRTLVARSVAAALATDGIDTVVVSTDGDAIAAEAERAGALVIRRPAELAGDTASSESALLHVLDELERTVGEVPEVLVFLQATSPFQDPEVIQAAVHRVLDGAADAVFAAAPSHAFLWRTTPDGSAVAVNHDAAVRPRRQDRAPEFRETGAFYVLRSDGFREHRHRFFGRTELAVVEVATAVDIDDEGDLRLAETIAHATEHPLGAAPAATRPAPSPGAPRPRPEDPHPAPAALNGAP